MQTFKCHICQTEYNSYLGLSRHCRITHDIDKDKLRVIVYNNGKDPMCKCGCGEQVRWNHSEEKFNDFKHGHYVRTTGGFYSPDGAKKSGETRKQRFASGEIQQWNKGVSFEDAYGKERAEQIRQSISSNTDRSKKISNRLTGKKKSEEHIKKITEDRREYWSKEENRLAQRDRRMQYIIKNGFQVRSKLEKTFMEILDANGIEYYDQFYVAEIPALYDFKIKGKNILIEVDGDFYHSNPIKYPDGPVYEIQKHNEKNDILKNEWAKANGYTLLRFWESDIQENRFGVVKTLIENLS